MKILILTAFMTLSTILVFGQGITEANEVTSYVANSITGATEGIVLESTTLESGRVMYIILLPDYYNISLMQLAIKTWLNGYSDIEPIMNWRFNEPKTHVFKSFRASGLYRIIVSYNIERKTASVSSF